MRTGHKAMGNEWNNEETVCSPSVALCHAEKPKGIWFDPGFPKLGHGLIDSFGGLITSNCSVPRRSSFLKIRTIRQMGKLRHPKGKGLS